MRHWLALTLLALLLATPWGVTSPVDPQPPTEKPLVLSAHSALINLIPCKGGERTVAVASTVSKQRVLLALYVYDPHGNCVARDEYTERVRPRDDKAATDDVAVEWFPSRTGTYTVEVRDQSAEPCALEMAIR